MLDFIYYPLSAVLWFWHKAFGALLGADSGVAWALAVVFLVITARVLLLKPVLAQIRTQRRMQELQPRITALRSKHQHDNQRLASEIAQLHRDHGVNPLMGFLPLMLQWPIVIGLLHVLRSFHTHTRNYVFTPVDVQSFLGARLFGAPLTAAIAGHHGAAAVSLAAGLILLSMVATHLTARISISRGPAATTSQAALLNRLSLWFFPVGAAVTGPVWPVGVLLYFATQSGFTLAQQYFLIGRSRPKITMGEQRD